MCLYERVSEYSLTAVLTAGNVICKVNICFGTKEQMTVTCQATCFMRKYEAVDLRSIDLSPKPDIVLNPVVHCARTHGSEGIIKTRQARGTSDWLKQIIVLQQLWAIEDAVYLVRGALGVGLISKCSISNRVKDSFWY